MSSEGKKRNNSYRVSKVLDRDLEFLLSKLLEDFKQMSTANPQVIFPKMTVSFAKEGQRAAGVC